jgi:hypothetical protein
MSDFCCLTFILAINLYRVLRAYVWLAEEVGTAAYLGNLERWDNIAHDTLNAFMTWVGDCLVVSQSQVAKDRTESPSQIYRCYIVWDNNILIVILPIALLVMSFSTFIH